VTSGKVLSERKQITGWVFDIQRFSLHDGPGIRTLVFMQGCPLACKWCCNPEGQKHRPQLRFLSIKCVGADTCKALCVDACPEGAISLSPEGKAVTDWELCQSCGKCTEACLFGARTIAGKRMTVEEVLAEVEKDWSFYNRSGGGITVGGGEPLIQFEFVLALLKRCKGRFFHTALETCGHGPWQHLKQISKYIDLLYYDIKHMNPQRHKELTGVSNELILSNARRVLSGEVDCEVIVRIPIVPGYNDSKQDVGAIARFVTESGGTMIELLPYHALGSSKYRQLGIQYELREVRPPSEQQMEKLRNRVKSFGLKEMTGVF
jgi:pyruvate formate lyase activating enzyme